MGDILGLFSSDFFVGVATLCRFNHCYHGAYKQDIRHKTFLA